MDPNEVDALVALGASGSSSRLSVSSPGRLLLRQAETGQVEAISDLPPSVSQRHHARRESYSNAIVSSSLYGLPEDAGGRYTDDNERNLFSGTPSSASSTSVRRIIRDDSTTDLLQLKLASGSTTEPDNQGVNMWPMSATPPPGRSDSSLKYSSSSIPRLGLQNLNGPAPKYLSLIARLLPNLPHALILSTIWLLILFYGEYSYPHSHSQFCNSYLPKESLLGRIVIVSNANVSQLPLQHGLMNFADNMKTSVASFLSDFNMRRSYRILEDKCAPDAFIFSGTLIGPTAAEHSDDNPFGTIDEEAFQRLFTRWEWIFPKAHKSTFYFAPSLQDIAFSTTENPHSEVARRLLYQRFVDYFGPLNWALRFGPYTVASVFTPIFEPSAVAGPRTGSKPSFSPSYINDQIKTETDRFIQTLHTERVIVLSPMALYPEVNATCENFDPDLSISLDNLRSSALSPEVTDHLLRLIKPIATLSHGPLPTCQFKHRLANNMTQTILSSYSDRKDIRKPGVVVLEVRNASMVNALTSSDPLPASASPYELNTIFFDTTTYTDMKGSYILLAVVSVVGCMAMANVLGQTSEFYPTSTLIEMALALFKFSIVTGILLVHKIKSLCGNNHFKPCLQDLEAQPLLEPFQQPPVAPTSRLLRMMALRMQITVEILLLCSIIVVPWCIFVMNHWMA